MEEVFFNQLRSKMCQNNIHVSYGKMMSSEAIVYNNKVFAFLSKKGNMVFKLGKDFSPKEVDFPIQVFNPFKKRGPLNGWYEIEYKYYEKWEPFAKRALNYIKS